MVSGARTGKGRDGRGGGDRSGPGGPAAPRSQRAFPAGRIPGRDAVGVGARAAGGIRQRQGRARLPGEQLSSQGELR